MSRSSATEAVSTVSATPGASATKPVSANAPETPVTSKTGQAREAVSKSPGMGNETPDTAAGSKEQATGPKATNKDPGAWATSGTPASVSAVQRDLSDRNMRTVTLMAVKEKDGPGYKFTIGLPDGRVNVYWIEDNPRFSRALSPGKYGTPAIQVTRNANEYVRDVRISVYLSGTPATPAERRCRLTVLAELDEKARKEHAGIWARTQRYSMSESVLSVLFPPPDEEGVTDKLHAAGRESTAPVARTPASVPALPAGAPMVRTPATTAGATAASA